MILKELIYSIKEDYKLMGDDEPLSNAYFAYLIKNARATILQQRYSDPRNIVPSACYQKITVPIGINAKSSISIPPVIKTTGNSHAPLKIYGVGIADTMLEVPLNVVQMERLPYVGSNPYTSDQIYCALDEDGYIVFNSRNNLYKLINSVVARGIYEDPEAVYAITNPNSDFYLSRYPIADSDLMDIRKLVDMTLDKMKGITKDNLNDSTEERLDQDPQGNK
jgi:hypothetical protein